MSSAVLSRFRRSSFARAVSWHRRLLAAAAAALAVALVLEALEAPAAPTRPLVVAASDLPAGALLTAEDVRLTGLPPPTVPGGALASTDLAVGRVLAAPVREGEPVTDVRVLGPALFEAYGPSLVATPVRLADADVAALLRTGDLVDVLAAPAADAATFGGTGPTVATVVAEGVRVVVVPSPGESAGALDAGGLVVLATTRAQAADLAGAAVTAGLSVRLLPP